MKHKLPKKQLAALFLAVALFTGKTSAVNVFPNDYETPTDVGSYSETALAASGSTVVTCVNDTVGNSFNAVRCFISNDGGLTFFKTFTFKDFPGDNALYLNQGSDPTVAILGNGTIIVGMAAFSNLVGGAYGLNCDAPNNFISTRSTDNGKTWSHLSRVIGGLNQFSDRPALLADDQNPHGVWAFATLYTNGNPGDFGYDGTCGNPHSTHEFGHQNALYSNDSGKTWSFPIDLGFVLDPAITPAILNGRLLYPVETAGSLEIVGCYPYQTCGHVSYANTYGMVTAHDGHHLFDGAWLMRVSSSPSLVKGPGFLLLYWMSDQYGVNLAGDSTSSYDIAKIVTTISTDGGVTWTPQQTPYPASREQFLQTASCTASHCALCFAQQRVVPNLPYNSPAPRLYDVVCGRTADGIHWKPLHTLATIDETISGFGHDGGYVSDFLGDYWTHSNGLFAFINQQPNPFLPEANTQSFLSILPFNPDAAEGCMIMPNSPHSFWLLIPPVLLLAWRRRKGLILFPILIWLSPTPNPNSTLEFRSTRPPLIGDCNHDGKVLVNELVTGIGMALDELPITACPAMECGGHVKVDCLIQAITNALDAGR